MNFAAPLTLKCKAKVNLILEVHKKREDGYHNLWTLFQNLEIHDTLTGQKAASLSLEGGENITENIEDNLIIKAARLLQKESGIKQGVAFSLIKNLPSGAGLGGGSSNAASALHICNKIWNLNWADKKLIDLASKLGADVPFFIKGGTAFGSGIGEILKPAPRPYPFQVLVATPLCSVATKTAYQIIVPRSHFSGTQSNEQAYLNNHASPLCVRNFHNDFQLPVLKNYPQIQNLYDKIAFHKPAIQLLSGSGASLFALFESIANANECLAEIKDQCRFVCVTEFC